MSYVKKILKTFWHPRLHYTVGDQTIRIIVSIDHMTYEEKFNFTCTVPLTYTLNLQDIIFYRAKIIKSIEETE